MSVKILIVDDALIMRVRLKEILKSNGFDIVGEASTGNEAIEKYKKINPDVVTMDIVMPEKTGIEALEEIMSYDKKARVIMVTAIEERDTLLKAVRLGATDYIVKPFDEQRVVGSVKSAMGIEG